MIPSDATHIHDCYGRVSYYRRSEVQHWNQVSEEIQTVVRWDYWTDLGWMDAGAGLRTDDFKKLKGTSAWSSLLASIQSKFSGGKP